MSNVQVMVACMQQRDDSLYREMNLQTDAILANQCDEYSYRLYVEPDGNKVELISTMDRGVGKNRNKALMNANRKYLLCSDQDMIYVTGYEKIVEDAFKNCPKADIVIFSLEYMNGLKLVHKEVGKFKRVHLWNCMRYGTARVAIRKGALDKAGLSFSTLYGGGAKYSSGEDSLFLRDAFRKKLKIYASPVVIAKVKQEESSWFRGYTEKYFIDKGVLIANAFPIMKHLFIYYFAYGMRKVSKEYDFFKICRLMRRGFKEFGEI